jgi:hypothetical protein
MKYTHEIDENCKDENKIYCPLWYHEKNLQQTSSGYGSRLTSPYKIKFEGRMYRIYVTIFSNAGSSWIMTKKYGKLYIL